MAGAPQVCPLPHLSNKILKPRHLPKEGEAQLGLGICEVWVFWGLFHLVLESFL